MQLRDNAMLDDVQRDSIDALHAFHDALLADLVRRNVVSPAEARGKAKFPENFPG